MPIVGVEIAALPDNRLTFRFPASCQDQAEPRNRLLQRGAARAAGRRTPPSADANVSWRPGGASLPTGDRPGGGRPGRAGAERPEHAVPRTRRARGVRARPGPGKLVSRNSRVASTSLPEGAHGIASRAPSRCATIRLVYPPWLGVSQAATRSGAKGSKRGLSSLDLRRCRWARPGHAGAGRRLSQAGCRVPV